MWDFSITRTLGVVLRSWPYVLLRIVVYAAITLAYIAATGVGAGVGYGVGHITGSPAGPPGFAVWGAIFGFGIVAFGVYLIREYILYIVKAGHVAVMVHLIDGRPLPDGIGQLAYGRRVVTARFVETNLLFVLDQLVKGVLGAITRLLRGVMSMLPIPGVQGLLSFIASVARIAVGYVDEVILGYNIRTDSSTPWDTAQRGLVLYAQNGRPIVKNALWLTVLMWGLTLAIFALALSPAAAILYLMPGQLAGWSFVLAIVFAWAFKAAVIEPFCIAALMQVYFRVIEGQSPDPEWIERLSETSEPFREMGRRATAIFSQGAST